MSVADWANNDKTVNQISDPLGTVGAMGMGGTWWDPGNIFGMGPGLPNPADAAMPYFNKIPDTIKPYYDPYINAGRESMGTLMGQYNSLINNPGAALNKAGAGFQQSPGYQFQFNQGMNGANNAAAAGGMLGTPSHQQQAASMASNLANQDYYNYLGNSLGMYQAGLGGLGNINQMGYNASDSLAQSLGNNLQSQGSLAFQGQSQHNTNKMGGMENISKAVGAVVGAFA